MAMFKSTRFAGISGSIRAESASQNGGGSSDFMRPLSRNVRPGHGYPPPRQCLARQTNGFRGQRLRLISQCKAALARVLARAEAGNMFRSVRSDPGVRWNFKALATSFLFQGAAVAILMLLGASQVVRSKMTQMTLLAPPPPVKQPKPLKSGAGGGGGQHSPLPPLKGPLPKPAPRVFTPPLVTVDHPALVLDASLIAPPDAWAAPTSAIGNPLGAFDGVSGTGKHGNIGSGDGGPGSGTRGSGPGGDAAAYSVGRGITAPSVLSKVDPEYSEEARKAKYSGAVMLSIVVNTDGRADSIKVIKSLGMGLDEKAIEAVERWRFRPGTKDGAPVRVRAQIEVNFRLL